MLILVCGGRRFLGRDRIADVLGEYASARPIIMHGGAQGADAIAGEVAAGLGLDVCAYPADWRRHGRAAGVIRNRLMLDAGPVLVIAFPGGKGTADCVREARRRGIIVRDERGES